ncbi:hypothetical protein [Candidatus Nitrososphaera sp. FF02]|uniref:hypothetical protein n=1 Tax=Candidatus Nitrososphaera sp. FF02 TaxID=3398226 RepID=UPI0039EC5F83
MSHTLDALTKPNVKEAIFAGIDVLFNEGDRDRAINAAMQKGAENGAAAEITVGVLSDVAEAVMNLISEYEKQQKMKKTSGR